MTRSVMGSLKKIQEQSSCRGFEQTIVLRNFLRNGESLQNSCREEGQPRLFFYFMAGFSSTCPTKIPTLHDSPKYRLPGESGVPRQHWAAGQISQSRDYSRLRGALLECASGSHSAVGEIYAREREQLRAVAHRIVHDMSSAEDVIHDAFAQILRSSKDFDPARGCARGWIYTIVRNTALKMQAKARREFALKDDTLNAICEREQIIPNPACGIPDSMALRAVLDHLEPNRRASLLRQSLTGARTGKSPNTSGFPSALSRLGSRRELMAMRRQLNDG